MRLGGCIVALALLSGCGGKPSADFEAAKDNATLLVRREGKAADAALAQTVLVDGVPVAKLKVGQTVTVSLKPGQHEIRLECGGGIPAIAADTMLLRAEAGKRYTVRSFVSAASPCQLRLARNA